MVLIRPMEKAVARGAGFEPFSVMPVAWHDGVINLSDADADAIERNVPKAKDGTWWFDVDLGDGAWPVRGARLERSADQPGRGIHHPQL